MAKEKQLTNELVVEYQVNNFGHDKDSIYIRNGSTVVSIAIPFGHTMEDMELQYSIGAGWMEINFNE